MGLTVSMVLVGVVNGIWHIIDRCFGGDDGGGSRCHTCRGDGGGRRRGVLSECHGLHGTGLAAVPVKVKAVPINVAGDAVAGADAAWRCWWAVARKAIIVVAAFVVGHCGGGG